jgi:hypothetical protein
MQNIESQFLSVFLLRPLRHEGIGPQEYRFDAPLTRSTAPWAVCGFPDESPARRRQTEPRLARAIVQALAITESI